MQHFQALHDLRTSESLQATKNSKESILETATLVRFDHHMHDICKGLPSVGNLATGRPFCRSQKLLHNAYHFTYKIGADTAENEPTF